jgi:hypothetical protein
MQRANNETKKIILKMPFELKNQRAVLYSYLFCSKSLILLLLLDIPIADSIISNYKIKTIENKNKL